MAGQIKKHHQKRKLHFLAAFFIFIQLSLLTYEALAQKTDEHIFPFNLEYDQISRILLVNFEADPDDVYVGFEPQVIPLGDEKEAHLIIGWRVDGRVDVYHQPGLSPDAGKYNIAGKGLANLVPCEIDTAVFVMTKTGLKAHYSFTDLYGRPINIKITENGHQGRRPFSLLAPMGLAAAQPRSLPCLFLHDFYFVRRKNTEFQVTISGKTHSPDKLPFPIDGKRMYFTRYCMNPVIATFLPSVNSPLKSLVFNGQNKFDEEGKLKEIRWNDNDYSISFSLEQPMPELNVLIESGSSFTSRFTLAGHKSAGSINGKITIHPEGDSLHMHLQPAKGWKPRPDRPSLCLLYRVAGVFRNWPRYYHWNAVVHKDDMGSLHLQSNWVNKGKK
ncbi:MAG: hypothetical protein LWX09_01930 [Bacteroidia bacterium]|jgi:hypothetical protein|nr:hypothetical protein [Bacteroidia bacterium]